MRTLAQYYAMEPERPAAGGRCCRCVPPPPDVGAAGGLLLPPLLPRPTTPVIRPLPLPLLPLLVLVPPAVPVPDAFFFLSLACCWSLIFET